MLIDNATHYPVPIVPPGPPTPAGARRTETTARAIGVGTDTARYGHYAVFLRDDLQDAAAERAFTENADGYAKLRARLDAIVSKGGTVHFHIRLDAAGQYADDLFHFLHSLANPAHPEAFGKDCSFTVSCGDPNRNKNDRASFFGDKKSDPVEARAVARYAVNEQPRAIAHLPDELRQLRQIAGRLEPAPHA